MTHRLSVAHLSAITLPPPEFIETAAAAGFDGVGLRLQRVTEDSPSYPLMHDPALMRATLTALRQTGLAVRDIEFVKITPEIDIAALAPLLDVGAELGASQLITAPYDDDLSRLADRLAALSDLARSRGIGVVLEFFPWTVVPDPAACWRVVQAAGEGVGMLVDSLHFDRSGSDLALLRQIPAGRLPFAHLCDAPRLPAYDTETLLTTARAERLAPGEGQIDLYGFVSALPKNIDLSLEVPMTRRLMAEGGAAVLRHIHAAARAFLDAR